VVLTNVWKTELKDNSQLMHGENKINWIVEELLKENEPDIGDIKDSICAASTVITETITEPGSKTMTNRRDKDSWKIRI